jgi:thioredoxin reductase
MQKVFKTEAEQVEILVNHYKLLGYDVTTEVPNFGQYVDIVAIKDGLIICIEAKLRAWKIALKQCEAHKFVSDYIYIAMGTKTIQKKCISEANKKGVGIIQCAMCDGKVIEVLKPEKNIEYWMPQRQVFLKKFDNSKEYWRTHEFCKS